MRDPHVVASVGQKIIFLCDIYPERVTQWDVAVLIANQSSSPPGPIEHLPAACTLAREGHHG